MRIGHGYDAHRLVEGRKLILGGVEIPFAMGLDGHSDADVLLHALSDALLGAAALGDIGKLFPDNDPTTKGIDSRVILRESVRRVRDAGFAVENCDVTIIAGCGIHNCGTGESRHDGIHTFYIGENSTAPYIDEMRRNIAEDIGVDISAVSVKATTEERMGFTGSGEGMRCHAVVLLS